MLMDRDALQESAEEIVEGEERERLCEAVSPEAVVCGFPATVRCPPCGKWFCDAHAEDQQWHPCAASLGFR
jgi:hypothetical protein